MGLKENIVTQQPYILLLVGNFLVLSELSNFLFAINVWSNAYIMSVLHRLTYALDALTVNRK